MLLLEKSHIKFDKPSPSLNLFLDECNKEVIIIRPCRSTSNHANICIQPIFEKKVIQFNIPLTKKILCPKFNSDRTIFAYHVEHNVVEFIDIRKQPHQHFRACSAKNSKFYGFFWTGQNEIVMVTNISVEYFYVDAGKRKLKLIKSFGSTTNWFIYQPDHISYNRYNIGTTSNITQGAFSVLMVSYGLQGSSVQPYLFSNCEIQKLTGFEIEGNWCNSEQLERSVTICRIYESIRLLVLQHAGLTQKSRGSRILVYSVDIKTKATTKTHVLDFNTSGFFAINIVDDLIVGHHQASKTSFLFDIMNASYEESSQVGHCVSLTNGQPITKRYIEEAHQENSLYSPNWVFIQPDFIINPELGHLMIISLDLEYTPKIFCDTLSLIRFLTFRHNSESVIYKQCRQILDCQTSNDDCPLRTVSSMFDLVAPLTLSSITTPDDCKNGSIESKTQLLPSNKVTLIQEEFHHHVLKELSSHENTFVISIFLEYIFYSQKYQQGSFFCNL